MIRGDRAAFMVGDFRSSILADIAHRPWPMPRRPWLMTQTWSDLLFAHWPVEPTQLRANVPSVFELDLFDGRAWIGVVPFEMSNVAPRAAPFAARFPELNVRTYVRAGGRPGVFFFSLDAASALAVRGARAFLNLPYHTASMSITRVGERIHYRSVRTSEPEARFRGDYAPIGPTFVPGPGTLEYFLTERYCLYHLGRSGRPYRLEIHHPPWLLQLADAALASNTMTEVIGIRLPTDPALLHFAGRQDVVAWAPTRLA
jgi:hypothetical protein